MPKKTGLGDALAVGAFTLVPVAVTFGDTRQVEDRVMAVGYSEALAVIVIGPSSAEVLTVSGDILSLEEFGDLNPEIREQIDALRPQS